MGHGKRLFIAAGTHPVYASGSQATKGRDRVVSEVAVAASERVAIRSLHGAAVFAFSRKVGIIRPHFSL